MNVLVSIGRVAVIALVVLVIGGCDSTVGLKESLNTTFGPGQAPSTYRVGGARTDSGEVGSSVRVIREAEVESGWTTGSGTPPPSMTLPPATQPAGG